MATLVDYNALHNGLLRARLERLDEAPQVGQRMDTHDEDGNTMSTIVEEIDELFVRLRPQWETWSDPEAPRLSAHPSPASAS